MTELKTIECGTRQGYRKHKRIGETPCDECRGANSEAERMRRMKNGDAVRRSDRDRYRRWREANPLPEPRTVEDRFNEKTAPGDAPEHSPELGPCLLWTGFLDQDGYGRLWVDGRNIGAHRVAVLLSGQEIPEGHEPDHLCRTRNCVRLSHLEVVTQEENSRRAGHLLRGRVVGNAAANSAKTHCKWGHEYTPENTRVYRGSRHCRACARAYFHARKNGVMK